MWSSLVLLEEGVCYDRCVLFALIHSVLQGQHPSTSIQLSYNEIGKVDFL